MIKNFEEYTSKLTDDEKMYIVPRLVKLLTLAIGKENVIRNNWIVTDINRNNAVTKLTSDGKMRIQIKTSEPRIRHMIHILRVSDTIPFLVATSRGYYISNDKKEIEDYMQSIDDRLRSIYQIRRALKRQIHEWGKPRQGIQREISFTDRELTY